MIIPINYKHNIKNPIPLFKKLVGVGYKKLFDTEVPNIWW